MTFDQRSNLPYDTYIVGISSMMMHLVDRRCFISSNNVKTLLHTYDHCSMMYIYLFYFFPIPSSSTNCCCCLQLLPLIHSPTCLLHPAIGSIVLTPPSTYTFYIHSCISTNTFQYIGWLLLSSTCPFYILVDFFDPIRHHLFAHITVAKFKSYTLYRLLLSIENTLLHNDRATTRHDNTTIIPHITTIRLFLVSGYVRHASAKQQTSPAWAPR